MKTVFFLSCLCGLMTFTYADDDSTNQNAAQMQLQQLIEVDKQIENLTKQKLEAKADMAKDIKHGSMGVLPRAGKRASRQAGQEMEKIQDLSKQLQQLEAKRQSILLSLQ